MSWMEFIIYDIINPSREKVIKSINCRVSNTFSANICCRIINWCHYVFFDKCSNKSLSERTKGGIVIGTERKQKLQ